MPDRLPSLIVCRLLAAGVLACLVVVAPSTVAGQTPQLPSRDAGAFLDSIRTELRLPGLAVIIVRSDQEPRIHVSGVRRWGGNDLIQVTDRMPWARMAKPSRAPSSARWSSSSA